MCSPKDAKTILAPERASIPYRTFSSRVIAPPATKSKGINLRFYIIHSYHVYVKSKRRVISNVNHEMRVYAPSSPVHPYIRTPSLGGGSSLATVTEEKHPHRRGRRIVHRMVLGGRDGGREEVAATAC